MFSIAYKNVILNWRLSFAALTAVVTAFMCLALFQGYIRGVDQIYVESFAQRFMYGDVILDVPTEFGERPKIKADQQSEIDQFNAEFGPELLYTNKVLLISGQISNDEHNTIFSGIGYSVEPAAKIRGKEWEWNTLAGVPLDQSKEEYKVLLGRTLAEYLNCYPLSNERYLDGSGGYTPVSRPYSCSDKDFQINVVTQLGQMRSLETKVVGLVDAAYKDLDKLHLSLPLKMAQLLEGTTEVSFYTLKFSSDSVMKKYMGQFNQKFTSLGFKARTWQEHPDGEMYVKTISLLNTFRNFVVLIIILVSGLSVFNSFLKIVKERTKEMGTLRSYGFSSGHLYQLIALETVILAAAGIVAGLVLSYFFCLIVNNLGVLYRAGVLTEPVPFILKPHYLHFVVSGLMITAVSLFASMLPLRSLLTKTITENLNEVQ